MSNVQVKFSADIESLAVSAAAAGKILRQVGKDMDETAKRIAAGDQSPETMARLKAQSQAYVDTAGQVRAFANAKRELVQQDRANTAAADQFLARLRDEAAATNMNRKEFLALKAEQLGVSDAARPLIDALKTQSGHMVSSRAATESLVLVHEVLSGRTNRLAGSAMILTQALAGQEAVAGFLSAALTPVALTTAAIGVAAVASTYASIEYAKAQQAITNASLGSAAASGLTADQLRATGLAAAESGQMSVSAATEIAEHFAATGVRSQAVIAGMAAAVREYATLTGQDMAAAEKDLGDAMRNPVDGAAMLNEKLGILDDTQQRQIRNLVDSGNKTEAVNIINQALAQRWDEASRSGAHLTSTLSDLTKGLSDYFEWVSRISSVQDAMDRLEPKKLGPSPQQLAQWDQDSKAGGSLFGATPEGQDEARRNALAGNVEVMRKALTADMALHGAHSDAVKRDQQALDEYTRAYQTFLPAAEKAHRLAELDAQMSAARRGHDAAKLAALSQQKAQLETAGEVMSKMEAAQRAADASETGGAKAGGGRKHDDRVQKWAEEIQAKEALSKDYFADETANELAFWQSKLTLTKEGSAAWLEVQKHIHDANRTLARQSYQDEIARLDDQLTADRNSWAKEQADWDTKLAFIKSKWGEQSSEYRNAHREMERALQEHDARELSETERSIREQGQLIKKGLDDQTKAREEAAKAGESGLKGNSGGSLFGDIKAEIASAQIHAQLSAQKLADNETLHAAETSMLDAAIAAAKAKYGEDQTAYKALIEAKRAEDLRYADDKRTLDAAAKAQQAADIAQLQAKYHSYIDGTVSTTVSGFNRMLAGQMTFKQFGIGVFQSIAQQAEQQVVKMASTWIVQHVMMASASKLLGVGQAAGAAAGVAAQVAASKATVAALAGQAGAAGVASMAAAPWPLDMTAPAFGAEMAAAAISLGTFAQGANYIPQDMVAQIHAGERIVPAADNAKLMALAERGAGAAGGGSSGDTHFHYNPVVNGQMPFADQLAAHESHIISMMHKANRNGAFRFR